MWIFREGRNVLLLAACQALFWSALMIGITMSGLVGRILAADPSLATLPAGIMALVGIFGARPASRFMQRFGRRAGFLIGAAAGMAGSAIAVVGIFGGSFLVFCVGSGVLGLYSAIGQYYRLAATDSIDGGRHGRAVSTVMAGGIVAAVLAPSLTVWSKDLFAPVVFAGSFLAVTMLSAIAVLIIVCLREADEKEAPKADGGRPISQIARQPVFIAAIANASVAQGVMILMMLATPLAMVDCGFGVPDAATVIQWHVFGMFVPSFFSGRLVDRFGAPAIGLTGAVILAASAVTAAAGIQYLNFAVALTLLGVGWNLMFVAGTTLIAASHRPEERGRVQGLAETLIAGIGAGASFAAAALLNHFGWAAVNLGAAPMLLAAAAATLWYTRRRAQPATAESGII